MLRSLLFFFYDATSARPADLSHGQHGQEHAPSDGHTLAGVTEYKEEKRTFKSGSRFVGPCQEMQSSDSDY